MIFNDEKGYGFIDPDGGGPAIGFARQDVVGAQKVEEGQRVQFEIDSNRKAPVAIRVEVINVG